MMATQKGGRGTRPPFQRTRAWLRAFETQTCAPEFFERMRAYARGRARLVARYRKVDEYYADELVQDVLSDTFTGKTPWDPERIDLEKHVMDAIKSRSRHHYVRAREAPHESLDTDHPERLENEITEHERCEHRDELRHTAEVLMSTLRVLATADPEVLMLLDAYEQSALKKVDVLTVSGLSSRQYHAARARLLRLRDQLPNFLKQSH